jgi:amino-acid N-acetyltransferase
MKDNNLKEQVELIRQVFGYVNQFKDKTFVIKIDSHIIDNPFFPALVQDLVLLTKMGIKLILVPGTKNRIDQVLSSYNIRWEMVKGIRVTSPDSMPFIKMAAFDVSNRIMTLLAENKADAVIGNWVKANRMGVIDGIDYQCAGRVEKLKTDIVKSVINEGLIPIFPNIGWSARGRPYNLNSNELAAYISVQLQAEKLFFITAGQAKLSEYTLPDELRHKKGENINITQLKAEEAQKIFEANREKDHEIFNLLSLANQVCLAGVKRVHIVNGTIEGVVLKEIFSSRGLGLMVYKDEHTFIRPMQREDIPEVLRIMKPMVEKKLLIPRTMELLEEKLADYVVYEVDGIIHACGALHTYGLNQGEIAGISVDKTYSNLGIGKKIISYLIQKAKKQKLKEVFVLTTQAEDWFIDLGFVKGQVNSLPEEKRKNYDKSRKSIPLFFTDL